MDQIRHVNQIEVFLHDKGIQVKVSKYTTCDDVIEMVLYDTPDRTNANNFGLYASARGLEKRLTGNALIAKIIRSYGIERASLSLHTRKIEDSHRQMPSKMLARRIAESTNKAVGSTVTKPMKTEYLRQEDSILSNGACSSEDRNFGTVSLMKMFIEEVAIDAKRRKCETRTTNNINTNDLDVAFIEEWDAESETNEQSWTYQDSTWSGIYTAYESDDLNECRIYDESSDEDSAFKVCEFDEHSDIESREWICEPVNQDMDKIRSMLNKVGAENGTDDQLLESFMKTLVQSNDMDDNDEGVGSMESVYSRSL